MMQQLLLLTRLVPLSLQHQQLVVAPMPLSMLLLAMHKKLHAMLTSSTPPCAEHGCNGMSSIVAQLEYLDYQNTFVAPVPHAGLLGVVKDFWLYLLRPMSGALSHTFVLSSEARNFMKARAQHIVRTCDFQRAYSCIVDKRGYWVMEDWLHWTETWSVYVLMPHNGAQILPEPLLDMWHNLRAGMLYFCRVRPLPDCKQSAEDAKQALMAYARLVQEHFGPKMCKFNLHVVICRLIYQELARGKAAFGNEYWIENLIQWAKSIVNGRTSKYPELVLVHDMLLDEGLSRMRREQPASMLTATEWLERMEAAEKQGGDARASSHLDVAVADGSQLLGVGIKLSKPSDLDLVKQAFSARIEYGMLVVGWVLQALEGATVLLFKHALVRGTQKLTSIEYLRAHSSQSFYALVHIKQEGTPVSYMAKVLFFVKLVADNLPSVRLAICELYSIELDERACGSLWHAKAFNRPSVPCFAISFDEGELGDKFVVAYEAAGSKDAWFVPYRNMSGQ